MKKLLSKTFALVLMLMLSVSAMAKQYCQETLTSTSGDKTIQLTCELVSEGNYRITVEGENLTGFGGSFFNPGAVDLRTAISSSTSTKIVCDIAAASAPSLYTPLYVMMPGEVVFNWPNDIEWGTCGEAVIQSEYCDYQGEITTTLQGNTRKCSITWVTNADGDVLVTIGDGEGSTDAVYRSNGIGGIANFKVYNSQYPDGTDASNFFTLAKVDNYKYKFTKTADLAYGAKLKKTDGAFEWACNEGGDEYNWARFEYTYGGVCGTASDLTALVPSVNLDLNGTTTYSIAQNTTYSTSGTGAMTYKSSNSAVASVTETGVITAVASGNANITITQAADDTYQKGYIVIPVSVINTSFGPTVAPTAPSIPEAQVRAVYTGSYALAVNEQYNTSNWGSSALTEERTFNNTPLRVYTMTNGVIVWGANDGSAAAIRGKDGYRSDSYTGLDASLMEYMHVDIWCDHERNFTSIINDNGRGAQGNTTANQWTSYNVSLSGINHGESGVENVRWMKFDGFAAEDVVAIANVYFYTTQDGSDTEAPAVASATYVAESATYTTAQVTVAATDNVGVTSVHFVDATNGYDKSYAVTNATSINETITLTGLKAAKTYNFTVTAKDATGNETATGATVQVITPAVEGNGNVFFGYEDRTAAGKKISAWGVDYPIELYYSMKWNANGSVTANLYLNDPDNLQSKAGCVIQILDYVTNNGNPIYYDMTKTDGVWSATMEGPFEANKNDFRFRIGAGTTTEEPRQTYKVGIESVSYTRTTSGYGTLCLPFNATLTGATAYTIEGVLKSGENITGISLVEVENGALEAGKAYIFKVAPGSTGISATYTSVAAHGSNPNLVGNLSAEPFNVEVGNYIIGDDDQLHKVVGATSTVTIDQYRAYVDLSSAVEVSGAPGRVVMPINDNNGMVTSLYQLDAAADNAKFMHQGQLYIRHNGHIFNAAGQIVK